MEQRSDEADCRSDGSVLSDHIDRSDTLIEHRVARTSNPNLKVGDIVEKDDDTVTADVVTKDGSLVVRYMVDRHAGMMCPADMDDSMEKGEN